MNVATTPKGAGPPLDSERGGLRDFWAVYERHHDEIYPALVAELSSIPEVAALLRAIPEEERQERSRRSRELMRKAILEDLWDPYLQDLRTQGEMYARLGLPFRVWFAIVGAFRPYMRQHLVSAYGDDRDRLVRALEGMGRLLDVAMAEVGESYLQMKERIIADQEEAVRDLSTSRAILTSVPDGVLTTDPHGRVTSINPALEQMTGWSERDVIGHPYIDVLQIVDEEGNPLTEEERFVGRAIASRTPTTARGYEISMVTRDGRRVPVGVTAAPIIDEDGDLLGGVDVIRDISHEREVDRMKSSLISTVSHELRTPLTMIRGFAELLLERDLPAEKARTAQIQIRDASDRLSRLIDDLLSVSKIDSGKLDLRLAPLDLAATVARAVEPMTNDRPIRIELPDGPPPWVMADLDKVEQIVTNLVSNAIKYSPEDAPVTVRVEAQTDRVQTSVTDEGIGISDDDAPRVFQKFFRVDRREVGEAKGTGLGLYITKNLVEIQGGEIRVEPAPGGGTTFTFTLPRTTEPGWEGHR